jgi:hypothetical protein
MKLTFLGLGFTLALLTGSAAACGSRRLGSAVNLTGTDEDLEARTLETVEHASHEAVDHVSHGCGTPSPTLEHRIAAAKVMQSYRRRSIIPFPFTFGLSIRPALLLKRS